MKISKSKQELARIISENGGWRDGAESASQSKSDNDISFYCDTAYRDGDCWCGSHIVGGDISQNLLLPNWHQTILSRAEYFHLYPAPDSDGWIECGVGGIPVGFGTLVDVKLRGGNVELGQQFTFSDSLGNHGGALDIIAYRLHRPEQAKPQFCDSVMRSIPEPEINSKNINITQVDDIDVVESKPTIEQLAADYRNANDCAERKQQETDAARADADAKLRALEIAGEALGLLVSPITAKQEPELVIKFKVGDEVECVESNIKRDKYNGMVGRLRLIDESDTSTPYLVDFGGNAKIWCHEVKFIRRP